MQSKSSGTYIIDDEFNIVGYNQTAKEIYASLVKGEKCYRALMGLDSPCGPCPIVNGVKGPRTYMDPIRNIMETVDAVEMPIAEDRMGYALVFSTVGNNATIAASLPQSEQELRSLSVVKAITTDYSDVYTLSVTTGEITPIRMKGKAIGIAESMLKKLDYESLMNIYIEQNVYVEDRQSMKEQTSLDRLLRQLSERETFLFHYRTFRDRELHYFYMKAARIGEQDQFDNIVVGFGCEDDDVKEKKRSIELGRTLSELEIDSLTGLYTKEAFYYHADKMKRERKDIPFDLMLMQVYNLPSINQQFGRNAEEKILFAVANLLRAYADETTRISYMGDGRFVSMLPHKEEEECNYNLRHFKEDLERDTEIHHINIKLAVYPYMTDELCSGETCKKIKPLLEKIRYEVGKDYIYYNEEMEKSMLMEQQLEMRFEEALGNGEIQLYYQPKYDCKSRRIVGAEALARWIGKDGEVISPTKFIPVLERSNRIYELDRYVFGQVCHLQKNFSERGMNSLPISVNVSRASMYIEKAARDYEELAREIGVGRECIPIEITESFDIRSLAIKEYAKNFTDNGFKLHLDDFGSGYSSLASIQNLPFEAIKLDKSLIDFIGTEGGESLLRHSIAFAKETGLKVVAEGVETAEQYWFLKAVGCDYIQGYYFSKPVDEQTFMKMLMR